MKIRKFRLSESFLEPYKTREVPWGPVGYPVYKRTYARRLDETTPGATGTEEWWQTCRRVIEGMFNIQKQHIYSLNLPWNDAKAQKTAKDAYERMFVMKWLPPGRGIWMMGSKFVEERGGAALNNCFAGNTNIFYDKQQKRIAKATLKELENQKIKILIDNEGNTANAIIRNFGEQDIYKVQFKPYGMRSNYLLEYEATKDHRWILQDGSSTTNLQKDDIVLIEPNKYANWLKAGPEYKRGLAHGLIFGDGTKHTYYPQRHFIRLCSDRDKEQLSLLEELPEHKSTTYPPSFNGDPVVTILLNEDWKSLPIDKSLAYMKGFIEGWLIADSYQKNNNAETIVLDTTSNTAAEWVTEWAPLLGYIITGWSINNQDTNYGPRNKPLNRITLSKSTQKFKVVTKDFLRKDTVYCATVKDHHKFLLAGGIVTGNCAFVSTERLAEEGGSIFSWMMDALMLGIGVGFDTLGAGTITIQKPYTIPHPKLPEEPVNNYYQTEDGEWVCEIADTREGWNESVQVKLDAWFYGYAKPSHDYSKIRKAGEPIKGFGGTSSGHGPLWELHKDLDVLYSSYVGKPITSVMITDTENLIGKCVVAGNVRRSAAIALGHHDDWDFLTMKNDQEKLLSHRWGSNNSCHAIVGMDYSKHAAQSQINGEPGYVWLDNWRRFGRMKDPPRTDDLGIKGVNPCGEQGLWHKELCTLSENILCKHDTLEDLLATLKISYLYAKTVTLTTTHWPETNAVMLMHRRIGLGMTGIVQAINRLGHRVIMDWLDQAHSYITDLDIKYSNWLCVPVSKKRCTIKPSGTTSKLPGVTPGAHRSEAKFYLNRIRFSKDSDMLPVLEAAGYPIEECIYSPNTMVVSFPVHEKDCGKTKQEVSIWEQLELAAQLQYYWSDNGVSITVTFNDSEAQDIETALKMYETRLKAVSFLKHKETGYEQAPLEPITEEEYNALVDQITPIQRFETTTPGQGVVFCDGDSCEIDWSKQ